jgi:hypothetical protein
VIDMSDKVFLCGDVGRDVGRDVMCGVCANSWRKIVRDEE